MMKDQIFISPIDDIIDFKFDENVVNVFPDMIKRSVPGYTTIISQIPAFALRYAQPNSNCYDLGCSLGATTLMLQQGIRAPHCHIIAVDNSSAMLERCQESLKRTRPTLDSTRIELRCCDIETLTIENASIVTFNWTLQFIPLEKRHTIISNIYAGLRPGGILILSEKVHFTDHSLDQWSIDRHHDFKRRNDYSDLEISQKRSALENVLITESIEQHRNRLKRAGFSNVYTWFQCFNFVSFFAQK